MVRGTVLPKLRSRRRPSRHSPLLSRTARRAKPLERRFLTLVASVWRVSAKSIIAYWQAGAASAAAVLT